MGKTLLLTPGFRFYPTDVELLKYYLKRKVLGKKFQFEAITEIDIYKYEPCDLPDKSCLKSRDLKWYFFSAIGKKYACGARINRATARGYWKTTGKDRPVMHGGEVVGMIKTLVFHQGRAPKGDRTDWVMHEYRLEDKNLSDIKDSYVLCMIFQKEGPGPRNGAQYGAPFIEEEWTDDEESCAVVGPSVPNSLLPGSSQIPQSNGVGSFSESCLSVLPSSQVLQPVSSNDVGLNSSEATKCMGVGSSSESCISDVVAPRLRLQEPVSSNYIGINNPVASKFTGFGMSSGSCISDVVASSHYLQMPATNGGFEQEKLPIPDDNDILSLLYDNSVDGGSFMENQTDKLTAINNADQPVARPHRSEGTDVFASLDDLGSWTGFGMNGVDISPAYNTTPTFDDLFSVNDHFLEMMDLDVPMVLPTGADSYKNQYDQLCSSFNCNPNRGESNFQVDIPLNHRANDLDTGQSSVIPPGGAYGSEDHQHWFSSCTAVPPNHSNSLLTEITYQCVNPDSIYGSQDLHDWCTK